MTKNNGPTERSELVGDGESLASPRRSSCRRGDHPGRGCAALPPAARALKSSMSKPMNTMWTAFYVVLCNDGKSYDVKLDKKFNDISKPEDHL